MDIQAVAALDVREDLSTKLCRHNFVDNSREIAVCSNAELLSRLERLAVAERGSLPELLACLSAVEERGLHLDQGYADMLEYCVGRLRWGEGAAMQRLTVAKAASLYPEI
jgi:hypothetical protein